MDPDNPKVQALNTIGSPVSAVAAQSTQVHSAQTQPVQAQSVQASSGTSQALATLQQISAQLSGQAKEAAEAHLQQLIQAYHKLAPIADAYTLASLAKQIGIAARALGESAATANLPSDAAPKIDQPQATSTTTETNSAAGDTQPDDNGTKAILQQARTVLETIKNRLALAAATAHPPKDVKAALAVVKTASTAMADALNAFGGGSTAAIAVANTNPASVASLVALNVLA